jgi:hypothetical protein
MKIKVNNIVNLQDARYCSALEVEMLSFCLERGSMYRLSDTMIADITEWLSGPKIVLNFGSDESELINFLPRTTESNLWHEWVYQPNLPIPSRSILRVDDPALLHPAVYENLLHENCYLELDINPQYESDMLVFMNEIQDLKQYIILNIDLHGKKIMDKLPYLPAIISIRSLVESDIMNLDYDLFESYLDWIENLMRGSK